jgi:hypothetical protein
MSHTLPWSLGRLALVRRMGGKTVAEAIASLAELVEADRQWSEKATSSVVKEERKKLADELARGPGYRFTVAASSQWVNTAIEI